MNGPAVISDECNSEALRVALELSMLNISANLNAAENPLVYDDVNCKSLNVTQCVTVPTSEHVAEIVGKQGIMSMKLAPIMAALFIGWL